MDSNANYYILKLGHLTNLFVGAPYPISVVAESILSEKPKDVRKTIIVSKNLPLMKQDLQHVHALVQSLFPQEQRSDLPIARRLKNFQENRKKLTSNPQISEIIEGYQIPFLSEPKQMKPPIPAHLVKKEESLMELEIETILRKGATQMVEDSQNQFLSLMLLVDSGYRPKHFLCSFQNESSHTFKGDCSHRSLFMQTRPKGCLLSAALNKTSRNCGRFPW